MLIDWFTVIAQIANFLILVWLMKRYLYHPILDAIDTREKRIASLLKDAETKKSDAAKERDLFQKKNQEFEENRSNMIKAAQDSAAAEGQKKIEAANKDADAVRAKRDAALKNEFTTLERELAAAIQKEAFSIARQTLSNLADANVETQIIKVFISHLSNLDEKSKDVLVIAAKADSNKVQVRSAFTLPLPEQEAIQQALKLVVDAELPIKFEVVPDLVCGIELSANGQKLAWSIDDYLRSLDSHINSVLVAPPGQVK